MSSLVFVLALCAGPAAGDPSVDAAMRELAKDPPIADVQRAALEHFRVASGDLSGYRAAARLRALLPTVSGSYTRDDSKLSRLSTQTPAPLDVNEETSALGRAYSASAAWDLGALVFSPSELEAYSLVGIHEDVVKEVTRLYYTRQQNILALLLDPPADARAKAALLLRTRELEAMLDAMTGGAFSRLRGGGRD